MPGLTPKQQRFVEEYLVDLNGTQAAIRAGYSAKTANEQAARLLAKVSIAGAVQTAKAVRAEKTGFDAEWVLTQTADVYAEARKENDRPSALRALDLMGKHVDVQAFEERTRTTLTLTEEAASWLGRK